MRLIGTIPQEQNGQRFSAYLTERGIENRCEAAPDKVSCQIWVADEDRLAEAAEELRRFSLNPADPHYNSAAPIEEGEEEAKPEPKQKSVRAPLTTFFLALCIFIYLLNFLQEVQISKTGEQKSEELVLTPVQKALLFDLPPSSPEMPYWQGLYELITLKLKGENTLLAEGPLFTQIRKGEVWRLFSPCILHFNFLHILFNMIWLWILGRPIEARIGSFRLLIITLAIGILTNIAQYLMSGPLFLGFSGVVMGWAGFIWMREKIAPWEGYPLQRATILFLALFVFGILALQAAAFLLSIFTKFALPVSIANTAHIVGLFLGAFFGRLSYFAWRVR